MDAIFGLLGLKKAVVVAGAVGGAISGATLPGPLTILAQVWKRMFAGAICGAGFAGYGAEPLAAALERPNYIMGIALATGLLGLSFFFKLLKAWNDLDLSAAVKTLVDNLIGKLK